VHYMHTVASLKKGSPVKFIEQETKTEDYNAGRQRLTITLYSNEDNAVSSFPADVPVLITYGVVSKHQPC
ncbi:MAG: hypothetical protein ACFN1B_09185, partial [Prevotella denticola]